MMTSNTPASADPLSSLWPHLSRHLTSLLSSLADDCPLSTHMQLYTLVYNYCTTAPPEAPPPAAASDHGARVAGEALYHRLQNFLRDHCAAELAATDAFVGESLLHRYALAHQRYQTTAKFITHIFSYLDRVWVPRANAAPTAALCRRAWLERLLRPLAPRLAAAMLSLVARDRAGEPVDRTLLRSCALSFAECGADDLYGEHVERPLLQQTSFDGELALSDVCEYMRAARARIAAEQRRVAAYLLPRTAAPLTAAAEDALVVRRRAVLWDAFQPLLERDQAADLANLYWLLARRADTCLQPLRAVFEAHVEQVGRAALRNLAAQQQDGDDALAFVGALRDVRAKYARLVERAFDSSFMLRADVAARRYINEHPRAAELLARYCDHALRRGEPADDVMPLFRQLDDKDLFQTYYARLLAKRLIHGTSASEDAEGVLIGQLKAACGYEYTAKLQRMFTDMAASRALLAAFDASSGGGGGGGGEQQRALPCDFTALVLATGSWPLQPPTSPLQLPPPLARCVDAFAAFHAARFERRRLVWLHHLARAELRAHHLPPRQYVLQCSTYQLAVLLLFNAADALTVAQCQERTLLDDAALRATLLALLKTRVLRCADGAVSRRALPPDTELRLNGDFRSRKLRVAINVPVRSSVAKGGGGGGGGGDGGRRGGRAAPNEHELEQERRVLIQATVVRIMKTRRSLAHNELVGAVTEQLSKRFKPKVAAVREALDALIEKDYIERDGDNYVYVP